MKNYSENQVLKALTGAVKITGKRIQVDGNLGIKSWGMVDFLKNHCGYTVVA